MIRLTVLACALITASLVSGQTTNDFSRSNLLTFNSFSLIAQEGWHRSSIEQTSGNIQITPLTTRTWSGGITYNYALSKQSALNIGLGAGALAFDFFVEGNEFDQGNRQAAFNQYVSYQKLILSYEYRHLINEIWLVAPSIGIQALFSNRIGQDYSEAGQISPDSSVTYVNTSIDATENRPGFAIEAKLRIGKFTKWNDVIGFHIGYRLGLNTLNVMRYETYPDLPNLTGSGIYNHNGSELYAGLSYQFNNYRKKKNRSDLTTELKLPPKEAKSERRKILESLRSKSFKVNVISGFTFIGEQFQVGEFYNSVNAGPGSQLGFSFARELPTYFFGAQYTSNLYMTRYKAKPIPGFFDVSNFNTTQVGVFAGSYWRSKTQHKRYMSFQGGLDFAYVKGVSRGTNYANFTLTDASEGGIIESVTTLNTRVFPLLNFGATSTIRLYEQLYLDFGITYYQGFTQVFEENLVYNNMYGYSGTDVRTSRGSNLVVRTGLSFHILK
jgi:hypothetical protein